MTQKNVSVVWQCIATIFVPTGLYAFHRINKLKVGGLIYLITIVINVLQTLIVGSYGISALLSLAIGIFGLMVAMLYMQKWSEEWNKNKITEL